MLDHNLYAWGPLVVAVAAGAFIADWLLTVAGARAQVAVRDRWSIEGSYEMNPYWVASVESGKWFTPRVVLVAALLLGGMALFWVLAAGTAPAVFGAGAGALLLVQVPTLMSHASNLVIFRAMLDPSAMSGHLHLRRWYALDQVAWLYLRFAVLWLALWAVSAQLFFLGGAFGAGFVGLRFRRLSREARNEATAPIVTGTAVEEAPGPSTPA